MKSLKISCIAVLALTVLAPAWAQEKMPAELPPYGQDKAIPAPTIVKKTLANGLEVWVLPRKGLPRVDFVLAVRGAGYGADPANAPGAARALAGLLNEGTTQRNSRSIAEAAQGMGGAVGGSAANDGIVLNANALASNAQPMLQLLAEVATSANFPDKEVDLAKANALQALKAAEAQPRFRADRAMAQAVYGMHPYGNTQDTVEGINALTPQWLRAEYAKRFRPDRALLIVTGRVTPAETLAWVEHAFGKWQPTGTAAPEIAAPPRQMPVQKILLERPGSVQATLRLGQPGAPASGDDEIALRLTSTILGTGFSSRININLREEKGYTYGARAGSRSLRVGGAISGAADVRNEVAGASMQEFYNEYRRIGTDLVPDAEMQLHKRFVAGTFLLANQMQAAVAQTLANNWLIGLPAEFFANYVPSIQKVNAEQVRDIARKYFVPENQSIVVVGDKAAIAEQMKAFGEFTSAAK